MNDTNNKLRDLSKGRRSSWATRADLRTKNKKWLSYSSNIARRVLAAIEDKEGVNQKTLANRIGVTPQYISKLVKGHENLSLETIAKLSDALDVELITFPSYTYSEVAPQLPFHNTLIDAEGSVAQKVHTLTVVSSNLGLMTEYSKVG